MNRIFVLLFVLFASLSIASALGEVFDGDTVYINDSRAYISATPHTITGSGWVENQILSKSYSGNVNWVMLTNEITGEYFKPTKLEYWDSTVVTPANDSSYVVGWAPVTRDFIKNNVVMVGKNRAYVITNIPVTAGVPVKFRYYLEQTWFAPDYAPEFVPDDFEGKYDIAVYPSSYGSDVRGAYDDGNLLRLDPFILLDVDHSDDLGGWFTVDGIDAATFSLDTSVYNSAPASVSITDSLTSAGSYSRKAHNFTFAPDAGENISVSFAIRASSNSALTEWNLRRSTGSSSNTYNSDVYAVIFVESGFIKTFDPYPTKISLSSVSAFEWYDVRFEYQMLNETHASNTYDIYIDDVLVRGSVSALFNAVGINSVSFQATGSSSTGTAWIDDLYVVGDRVVYENVTGVNISMSSSVTVNETVSFNSSITPANATNPVYSWSFGDGSSSNLSSGSHVFSSVGAFLVSLNVTDALNNTVSDSLLVIVSPVVSSTSSGGPFEFEPDTLSFLIGVVLVFGAVFFGFRLHPVFFSFGGLALGVLTLFVSETLITDSAITFLLYAFSVMLLLVGFVASMYKR